MPDRVVKTTLVIDDKGSVKVVKGVGDEAARTESKLSHLDKGVKGIGKSFGGLKSLLMSGVGLVGAGGLVFGLKDVISKTKEVAQETEQFHTQTGIGAQQSLKYSQALKARGLSGEAVTKAFGFLAKNVRSAELQEGKFALSQSKAAAKGKVVTTELGRQAKALRELTGMSVKQYMALGNEEKKLNTVTKAFENLAAGEKKTRLEKELFGRGGQQLSTVLEKNNLSLNHYVRLVEKYYGTLKGGAGWETQLLEKQSEAKLAWEGLEFQLGTKLTPVLIKVFGWFAKVSLEIERGRGPWGRLAKDVEGVIKWLKGAWEWFSKLVGPSNALKVAVFGLGGAFAAVKLAGFVSLLGKLIGMVVGLRGISTGFQLLGVSAAAAAPEILVLTAALVGMYEAWKHAEQIRRFFGIPGTETKYRPGPAATPSLRAGARGNRAFAERLIEQGTQKAAGPQERREAGAAVQSIAQEVPQLKADLHIDSLKVAEAIAKNPRAIRRFSEEVAHYGLKRAARE